MVEGQRGSKTSVGRFTTYLNFMVLHECSRSFVAGDEVGMSGVGTEVVVAAGGDVGGDDAAVAAVVVAFTVSRRRRQLVVGVLLSQLR